MAAMRPASISPKPMAPEDQAATPDQKSKHDGVSATRNSGNNYAEKPAPQGALSPSLFDSLQQRASKLKVLLNSLNGSSGNRTSGSNYAEYSLQRSPSPGTRPSDFSAAQHGKSATQDCPGLSEGRALGGSQNGASRHMPLAPQLPINNHAKPATGHRVGATFPSAAAQASVPITAPMPGCGAGQDRPTSWPSSSHRSADAGTPYRVQAASGAPPHGHRDASSILQDGAHPPGKAPSPGPGPGDPTILRHTQPRQPCAPSVATAQDQPRDASYQRRSTSDGSHVATGTQPLLRVSPRITAGSTQPPINGAHNLNPRQGNNIPERPAPNQPKSHAATVSAAMRSLPQPPAHRPHPPPAPPPAQPYTTGAVLSKSAGGSSDGSGRSTGREPLTLPLSSPLPEPALPVQPRPSRSPSPPHSQSTGGDMHSPAARGAALHAAPYDPYNTGNVAPVMPPRRLSSPGEAYHCQDPMFDPRGSQHPHNFQRLTGDGAQRHDWPALDALGAHPGVLDIEGGSPMHVQDSFSPRSAAAASGSSLVGMHPDSPQPGFANQVAPPRSQAAAELCAMLSKMAAVEPAGLAVAAAGGPPSSSPGRAPSASGSNGSGGAAGDIGTVAGSSAGGSQGHGSRAERMRGRAASAPGVGGSEGGGDVGRELKVYKAGRSSGGDSKAGGSDGVGVHGVGRRSSGAGSSSAATYDSEAALAHAVAVARASAIAAFLNPVARTYRQRSDFSTTGHSDSSSPLIAPLAPLFSGVPAAAAPFLGTSAEQLPNSNSPRGGTSVVSGRESLPSGSINSPRSGTTGSQYEKILARKMASLVPAERRPRPASGAPGPEFMRRNEVLLRKRQAWATSKRKVTSGGSPVSSRRQQQMQGRRAVSAQGNEAEGCSHPQLQRSLLDLHRWADWRNRRLEVLREERQAEERERDKVELTFKPAIDERSRRLAKMVRSRGTYTPLPSGASHRSVPTAPSATISTSAPGCCTTTTAAAAAVASTGPMLLSQDGSSEGPAAWSLPYKYTAHIPGASRSSAGGISTGSGATTLGGGTMMSVDQLVEALETARGGGRHRHRSGGTAPGMALVGSYSARCRPLLAVEQLAAARNSRMRGRYASSGGGSPYDDPVMGAVAQAINDAAIALQLDRLPLMESDASVSAMVDVSVFSPASLRGEQPPPLLPPPIPLLLSDAQLQLPLDTSPQFTSEFGRLTTARDDAAVAAAMELQEPQPTTSPSVASKRTTARSPPAGPTHTQARASARASSRMATSVASNGSRRSARRQYDASGSGGSYAKAYSGGMGGASGRHASGAAGGMSNGVAAGFGSDFSGDASTNVHTGRSHNGSNTIPVSYAFLNTASQNQTPSPSPRVPVAFAVSEFEQGGLGSAQEAAVVWDAAAVIATGGGGGVGLGRPEGLVNMLGVHGGCLGTSALRCGLPCSPSSSGSIAVGAFRSGSLASSPGSSPYLILPYDSVGTLPPSSSRSPSQSQSPLPRVSTPTASASSGAAAVGGPTFSVVFSGSSGGGSGTGPAADGHPSSGGVVVSLAMSTSTFLLPRPSTDVDLYHTCLSIGAAAAGRTSTTSSRQPSVVRFSTDSENTRRGSAGGLPDASSLSPDSQDPTPRRSGAVSDITINGGQHLQGPSHGRSAASKDRSLGGTLGALDSSHARASSSAKSLLPSALSNDGASKSSSGVTSKSVSSPNGAVAVTTGSSGSGVHSSVAVGTATTAASRMESASRQASASSATGGGGVHPVHVHPSRSRAVSAVVPSASAAGPCAKQSPKRNVIGGAAGPRRGSAGSPLVAPSSSDPFTGMRFSKILSQQFACTASSLAAARALSQQLDAGADVPAAALMAPTCSAPELTAAVAPQTPGETTKYLALLAALAEKRRQPPPPPVVAHQHPQHPSSSAPTSRQPSGYANGLGRMAGRTASSVGTLGGGVGGADDPAVRDAAAGRSHFRLDEISPGVYAAGRPVSASSGPAAVGWSDVQNGGGQPAADNDGQMGHADDATRGKLGPWPQGREMVHVTVPSSSQSSPRGKAVSFNLATNQHKSQSGNSPPPVDAAPPLFIAFPAPSTAAALAMPLGLTLTAAAQRQASISSQETVGAVPERHATVWTSTESAAAATVEDDYEQGPPSDMTYTGRRKRRSSEDGCSKASGKAARTLVNGLGESSQAGDIPLEGAVGGGGAGRNPGSSLDPTGAEQRPFADALHGPTAERLPTPASAVTSPPPPPSPPPPSTVEEDDDPLAALQALIRRVAHLADDCDAAAAAEALKGHVTAVSSTLTSPCLSSNPATSAPDVAKLGERDLGQELISQVSSAAVTDRAMRQEQGAATERANAHTILADNEAPPNSHRQSGRSEAGHGDNKVAAVRAEPVAVGTLSPARDVTCESASGTGGSGGDDYAVTSTGSCNLNLTDVVSSSSGGEVLTGESQRRLVAEPSTSTVTSEAGPLQAAIAGVLGSQGSTPSQRSPDQDSFESTKQQHSSAGRGGTNSSGGGGVAAAALTASPNDEHSSRSRPALDGENGSAESTGPDRIRETSPGAGLVGRGRQAQLQAQLHAAAAACVDEALTTRSQASGSPSAPVVPPTPTGSAATNDVIKAAGSAATNDVIKAAGSEALPPMAGSLSVTDLVKRAEQLRVAAMSAAGMELGTSSPAPASRPLVSWGSTPVAPYSAVLHSPSTPLSALNFTHLGFHYPDAALQPHTVVQQPQPQQQQQPQLQPPQQQQLPPQEHQKLRQSHSSPSALRHDDLRSSSSCCTTPTPSTTTALRVAAVPIASGGASNNVAVTRHVSRVPGSNGANSAVRRRPGSNGGGGGSYARTPSPPGRAMARRASVPQTAAGLEAAGGAKAGANNGDFVFPRLYVDGALTAAGIRAQNLGNTNAGGGGGGGGGRQRQQPAGAVGQQPQQHAHGRNKPGGNAGGAGGKGGGARGPAGGVVKPAVAMMMPDGQHEEELEIPHEISLAGGLDPSPVAAPGASLRRVLAPSLAGAMDTPAAGPSAIEPRYSVWSLAEALHVALGKAAAERDVDGAHGPMGQEAREGGGAARNSGQERSLMEEDGGGAAWGADRCRPLQDTSAATGGASTSAGMGGNAGASTSAAGMALPSIGSATLEEPVDKKQHRGVGGAVMDDGATSLNALHDLIRQMAEL